MDNSVNLDQLRTDLADQNTRTSNYRTVIPEYYKLATDAYTQLWGESWHTIAFQGDGSNIAEEAAIHERWLADQAGFHQGQRILDLGCGIAGPARTIAAHTGAHITGITISPIGVAIGRDKVDEAGLTAHIEVVEGDFMRLPFDDNTFDAAYTFDATCHMPDKGAGYKEVARALKPGAVFTGFDWFCADNLTDDEYAQYVEPICSTFALPNMIPWPQLQVLLAEAGFSDIVTDDASRLGNLERQWQLTDETIAKIENSDDPALAGLLIKDSLDVFVRACRTGRFVIGYFRCKKTI